MKLSAAVLSAVVLVFVAFPVLFATGDASTPPPVGCVASGAAPLEIEMGAILATIRTRESSGNYQARGAGSTASGAYQFINSTWAAYGGYASAWLAPPATQDAKASEHVQGILDANGNDVAAVPVVWYIGFLPGPGDPAWEQVPGLPGVNRLTVRQYQAQWLELYAEQLDGGSTPVTDPLAVPSAPIAPAAHPDSQCVIAAGTFVSPDGWAYPGPTDVFARAPVDNPHHDYPAWDWSIPEGTPIYATHGGQVASVSSWARNWYDQPCRAGEQCSRCGIGVTIVDAQGTRWNYCHGSQRHVEIGDPVTAGALIMTSGNTGRSTTPHIHLGIRTADGQARCPQPLLVALRDRGTGVDPVDLPTTGCID